MDQPNNPNKPQDNNIPNLDEALENKKLEAFEKEFIELQKKHGYYVVPLQNVSSMGTHLALGYMKKEVLEEKEKIIEDSRVKPIKN